MEWRSIVRAVKAGTRLQHQYDDHDNNDGGGGGVGEWPIYQPLVLLYITLLQNVDRLMTCSITYPYSQALRGLNIMFLTSSFPYKTPKTITFFR